MPYVIGSQTTEKQIQTSTKRHTVSLCLRDTCFFLVDSPVNKAGLSAFSSVSFDSFVPLLGAAVDSTVSEPEQQGHLTPSPAHTLRLLHLSGQGTLVQQSLSQ